jgi:hypothetical protein
MRTERNGLYDPRPIVKTCARRHSSRLAKLMALHCFPNSKLENLHAGKSPRSKTGDYTDVKVVTPYGEIPWNEVSRLNDDDGA